MPVNRAEREWSAAHVLRIGPTLLHPLALGRLLTHLKLLALTPTLSPRWAQPKAQSSPVCRSATTKASITPDGNEQPGDDCRVGTGCCRSRFRKSMMSSQEWKTPPGRGRTGRGVPKGAGDDRTPAGKGCRRRVNECLPEASKERGGSAALEFRRVLVAPARAATLDEKASRRCRTHRGYG